MRHIRKLNFFAAVFTALALFFGIGPGHSLINAQSMHSMSNESLAQCQSVCPPTLTQKQKTPEMNEEDDDEPEPMPLQLVPTAKYVNILYAVLLSVLALQFLQRRPPDLLVQHGYLRI